MFFTDDLMLFCEVSEDQVGVVIRVLDNFCRRSGEKVSKAKTVVYFSSNVNNRDRRNISSHLGFTVVQLLGNIDAKVSEFVTENGSCNWELFAHIVPHEQLLQIAAIYLPRAEEGDDKVYWAFSNSGYFSIKSAYNMLRKENNHENDSCCRCHRETESELHALRDCTFARQVWNKLVPKEARLRFYSLELKEWTAKNISNDFGIARDVEWKLVYRVAVSSIWLWRNQGIFKGIEIDGVCKLEEIRRREIPQRNWQVSIKRIFREANQAADKLAKMPTALPVGLHIFRAQPRDLDQVIINDVSMDAT
ncbi:hypothetical protein DITRI_Ditri04bG0125700 [Diplodiscus trichospermus]